MWWDISETKALWSQRQEDLVFQASQKCSSQLEHKPSICKALGLIPRTGEEKFCTTAHLSKEILAYRIQMYKLIFIVKHICCSDFSQFF
jgi:hypothetical protein